MCDPVTLSVAALAVSAVGTAVSTVGAVQQANYEVKVADRNAKMADSAAVDAIERGKRESMLKQRETGQLMGRQIAAMGANGTEVGFGSSADILGDTARIGAEDAQIVRENSARESLGYSINAANYRSQAQSARMSKVGMIAGGASDLTGTILGGAQQMKEMKQGSAAPPNDIVVSRKGGGGFF